MSAIFKALGGRKQTNVLVVALLVVASVVLRYLGVDIPMDMMVYMIAIVAVVASVFIKKEGDRDILSLQKAFDMYTDEKKTAKRFVEKVDEYIPESFQGDDADKRKRLVEKAGQDALKEAKGS